VSIDEESILKLTGGDKKKKKVKEKSSFFFLIKDIFRNKMCKKRIQIR